MCAHCSCFQHATHFPGATLKVQHTNFTKGRKQKRKQKRSSTVTDILLESVTLLDKDTDEKSRARLVAGQLAVIFVFDFAETTCAHKANYCRKGLCHL